MDCDGPTLDTVMKNPDRISLRLSTTTALSAASEVVKVTW